MFLPPPTGRGDLRTGYCAACSGMILSWTQSQLSDCPIRSEFRTVIVLSANLCCRTPGPNTWSAKLTLLSTRTVSETTTLLSGHVKIP